jgi:hypothetical protein
LFEKLISALASLNLIFFFFFYYYYFNFLYKLIERDV